MNCKPGDIAIVIGNSIHAGRLVEILYVTPGTDFHLPNGVSHRGAPPGRWVFKSLGSPFIGAFGDGMYGSGADHRLWPLRGITNDVIDNTEVLAHER